MEGLIENRNVHYTLGVMDGVGVQAEGRRRAATIVEVVDQDQGVAHLHVHVLPHDLATGSPYAGELGYPATLVLLLNRFYSETGQPGTWRWMDRA